MLSGDSDKDKQGIQAKIMETSITAHAFSLHSDTEKQERQAQIIKTTRRKEIKLASHQQKQAKTNKHNQKQQWNINERE